MVPETAHSRHPHTDGRPQQPSQGFPGKALWQDHPASARAHINHTHHQTPQQQLPTSQLLLPRRHVKPVPCWSCQCSQEAASNRTRCNPSLLKLYTQPRAARRHARPAAVAPNKQQARPSCQGAVGAVRAGHQSQEQGHMRLQTQWMHSVQAHRRENASACSTVLSLRTQHSQKNLHMVQQLLGGTPAPSPTHKPQAPNADTHTTAAGCRVLLTGKNPSATQAGLSNIVAVFTMQGGRPHSTADDTVVGFRYVSSYTCTQGWPTAHLRPHCDTLFQLSALDAADRRTAGICGCSGCCWWWCHCTARSHSSTLCHSAACRHGSSRPAAVQSADHAGCCAVCRLLSHQSASQPAARLSHTHWVCAGLACTAAAGGMQGARARSKFLNTQGSTCPPVPA